MGGGGVGKARAGGTLGCPHLASLPASVAGPLLGLPCAVCFPTLNPPVPLSLSPMPPLHPPPRLSLPGHQCGLQRRILTGEPRPSPRSRSSCPREGHMLQGLGGQSCTRHLTDCPEGRNCSLPRGPVTMFTCVSHRGHSGFLPDGNERIPHPPPACAHGR